MTRLLICAPSYAAVAPDLERLGAALDVLIMDDAGQITLRGEPVAESDAQPQIAWADHSAFLGPGARTFFRVLLGSPRLTWVQSAAAGYDHPLFGQIVAKGAILTTSHGQAVGIADYVLWSVLDHFQNGDGWRADQAAKTWKPRYFKEVRGTRWMIIGFGSIGQAVATRARAFGALITGVRRDQTPHPLADDLIDLARAPGGLPTMDVVVLSTPLSAATRGLANAGFFAAMKPGSVLVNVGRGGLVDEAALLTALDRGAPGHAVLDVFQTEPLPAESPFWTHPRVRLTPHSSGITAGQDRRNATVFLDNLGRFLGGEPLLDRADPADVLSR